MKMLLDSEWVDREKKIPVRDPFDDSIIDHVPSASAEDAELALASAVKGFEVARPTLEDTYLRLVEAAGADGGAV